MAVGPQEKASDYRAGTLLDVDGDLVLPGFINTHTHASMSLLRSLGDDVPDRLHKYMFPLEKQFVSREMVRLGAELGNVEMLKWLGINICGQDRKPDLWIRVGIYFYFSILSGKAN